MPKPNTFRFFRGTGVLLLIFLSCVVGCTNSHQKELTQAKSLLALLEQSDADKYLPYQIQAIRTILIDVESAIRVGEFTAADQGLRLALAKLDSAVTAYKKRRNYAKNRSTQFLRTVVTRVNQFNRALQQMPRASYVDQSRFDRIRYKMKRIYDEIDILNEFLRARDYNAILQKEQSLNLSLRQIEKALNAYPEQTVLHNGQARKIKTQVPQKDIKKTVAMD